MASNFRNSEKIFTFISESSKQVLVKHYSGSNLFVDNVVNLQCANCGVVVIYHNEANCGHLFCRECSINIKKSKHIKCPKCARHMDNFKTKPEIESRVSKLKAFCPNRNFGCNEVHSLRLMTEHIKECKIGETSKISAREVPGTADFTQNLLGIVNKLKDDIDEKLSEHNNCFQSTFEAHESLVKDKLDTLEQLLRTKNGETYDHSSNDKGVENRINEMLHLLEEQLNQIQLTRNQQQHQVLNILLVGEIGTGKSTLINAFANCVTYKTFNEARHGDQICVLPAQFTICDEDYDETEIKVGPRDSNECTTPGQPGTRTCKSYLFALNDRLSVRWIDSCGFGVNRGPEQDAKSVNDIIRQLHLVKHLNAIAIVVNSNQARNTQNFEYCLKQVLSNFHRSAVDNLLFVFTHGVKPGDTMQTLKAAMKSFNASWNIPFDKDNIFCFENQAFRHLMALKRDVKLDNDDVAGSESNWNKNWSSFRRLMEYVERLSPHDVTRTTFLHRQQTFSEDVSTLIRHISDRIQDGEDVVKNAQCSCTHTISALVKEKTVLTEAENTILDFVNDKFVIPKALERVNLSQDLAVDNEDVVKIMKRLILLEIYGPKLKSMIDVGESAEKYIETKKDVPIKLINVTFNDQL